MSLADLMRKGLAGLGYVLWRREFLRYGIDPFLDVARLARSSGSEVRTVFDVGANVGQTAHEVLAALPGAQIFSFEPHPNAFEKLSRIHDKRLSAYNLALGKEIGEVTMYEFGKDGTASHRNSLVNNATSSVQFGYSGSEIKVPCTTLDQFCKDHQVDHIDLLKIDVEGFELSVLEGARQMLEQRRVSCVYAEFNDLTSIPGATGGALLPLAEYLAPFGMRFIASYTDFVDNGGQAFVVANALWARR